MEIIPVEIEGLLLVRPTIHRDDRGSFLESFRADWLKAMGVEAAFVQDNESRSKKGVLRGLHFQCPPHEQGKLIRVISGSALDVSVDIRHRSPTYGKWFRTMLTPDEALMLWIPPGFAHGFLALEENTVFQYKCTGFYHHASEYTLLWNDPDLAIPWGFEQPLVSDNDRQGNPFRGLPRFF
jgi:dTDP-4-dehydrorhamnose 3,5-epimerase